MMNRRTFGKDFVKASVAVPAFATIDGTQQSKGKLKVMCVGGHPDDPESGCGGSLAKLALEGHEVVVVYLTRGERGIEGTGLDESARIRTKEAECACEALNARPVFLGQIDGDTEVNNEWVQKTQDLLEKESPDIVFTHWPVDSHKDHQVASLLTTQSWVRLGQAFDLYFFEVCTGSQTMGFKPTHWIDITSTSALKRKAIYCHVSQNPDGIYVADDCNHELMAKFRGIEINRPEAEAFVKMNNKPLEF